MDEFKNYVVNEKDQDKKMKWIKVNFDANAYSFWKMDYDKLESECKEDYKTFNAC